MTYLQFRSQYRKVPSIEIQYEITGSNTKIIDIIQSMHCKRIAIECYPGIDYNQVMEMIIKPLGLDHVFLIDEYSYSIEKLNEMFKPYLFEDRVFGKMADFQIRNLYPETSLKHLKKNLGTVGSYLVYGFGASLIENYDLLICIDISRWEIQQRFRRKEIGNWKLSNLTEDYLQKYKRGYFIEWRIADRLKLELFNKIDFYIDGNQKISWKMMTGQDFNAALADISCRPFRLTPYFDPEVWGGQWMKETCNLDPDKPNYAWSFDGVPEENSLSLIHENVLLEMPAINLVLTHPRNLLGADVYHQFGAEFPIRFDFLDTMGGQNLSLQVHPLKAYIKEQFGIEYTQDESYYILDATEKSCVYLGLKEGIDPEEFITSLKNAQITNEMDVERYVNRIPVKKHDHLWIPAGTVHCSGKDTMVLEISATPYIFTFKLWDWNRLGLDGKPRPINIEHGAKVIQYDRDTKWVFNELINKVDLLSENEGVIEERTGLHALEFIETRRYWFNRKVLLNTLDTVNVLNLVEGQHAVVESPTNAFDPFPVFYAETFIIPAAVGEYTIRPFGVSEGQTIGIVKAFVRSN